MDHLEAMQMKAVERYGLGDLSVSEVEGFERHFFDCPQCSEDLRILSVLQENGRSVFFEQTSTPSILDISKQPVTAQGAERAGRRWAGWFTPAVLGPALALLAVAGFLGYEIGERNAGSPQSVNAYPLYAASSGSETVIAPPAGAPFFSVYMDRTWERDYASYRVVVHDQRAGSEQGREQGPEQGSEQGREQGPEQGSEQGREQGREQGPERASLPLQASAPGRLIQVLFPARSLAPGRYLLSILGRDGSGPESKVADYSFTLRPE